jgi:hypothetical protein
VIVRVDPDRRGAYERRKVRALATPAARGFNAWSLLPGYSPDLLHEAHCVGDTPVLGDPSIL